MKSLKSKIGVIVLVLSLVLTMAPSALFADDAQTEEYNLYVSGVRVTSENANDVLSDGGSVAYDKENNQLILTDANISVEKVRHYTDEASYKEQYAGIDYEDTSTTLTIYLNGKSTITGYHTDDLGMGIYEGDNNTIIFKGKGSLDINIDSTFGANYGIKGVYYSKLQFEEEAKVNIKAAGTGINCYQIQTKEESRVTVDAGVYGVNLGAYYDTPGSVEVHHISSLEVYSSGLEGTAFHNLAEDEGNLEAVYACAGDTNDQETYYQWKCEEGDPSLSSYKYVRIPYKASRDLTVSFDAGDHASGSMDSMQSFMGSRKTLPNCEFEPEANYSFAGWKVEGDANTYRPGDRVTITDNTTVTATWMEYPMDLFIGGVRVNKANRDDVFGDGTVSVQVASAPSDVPGEILITLDNATIEMDKRIDGEDPYTEYGILNKETSNYNLHLNLIGANKIVNNQSYVGIVTAIGIQSNDANKLLVTGDGSLDISMTAERKNGSYYGINNAQPATIDGLKININIGGVIAAKANVKGYYIQGNNTVSLINNSELNINTYYGMAFDSNNKEEDNVDLDVEKGSVFQATSRFTSDGSWYAVHGNGWVTFSEGSLAQGVLVSNDTSIENASIWDGKSEIGTYQLVRIPNDKIEPETTTQQESTTQQETTKPKTTKKANPIKVKLKKKKVKIKAKKLKKKSVKVKVLKVNKAVGKVTFKKVKKGTTKKIYKKVKITKKGLLKLKKGKYKKKTYKIKVAIKAKGNNTYYSKTVKKTIKVKIK